MHARHHMQFTTNSDTRSFTNCRNLFNALVHCTVLHVNPSGWEHCCMYNSGDPHPHHLRSLLGCEASAWADVPWSSSWLSSEGLRATQRGPLTPHAELGLAHWVWCCQADSASQGTQACSLCPCANMHGFRSTGNGGSSGQSDVTVFVVVAAYAMLSP
jgi:hypothetical protein